MSFKSNYRGDEADHQDTQCDNESVKWLHIRDNREDGIPHQTPRTRCDPRFIDGEIESRLSGHWNSTRSDTRPADKVRKNTHVLVKLDLK